MAALCYPTRTLVSEYFMKSVPALSLAVFLALAAATGRADDLISLVGKAAIPGTAKDKSGLTEPIPANSGGQPGIPADIFGSAGSAIDYTGADNLYLMASDRGPTNGDAALQNRVHTVRLTVHPGQPTPV